MDGTVPTPVSGPCSDTMNGTVSYAAMTNEPASLLFYCRPGFEDDCAAEIMARASAASLSGYVKARSGDGWLRFHGANPGVVEAFAGTLDLARMIFPRQWLLVHGEVMPLPPRDRVRPILDRMLGAGLRGPYAGLRLEHPDTNDGKQISALTRRLLKPLRQALDDAGIRIEAPEASRRLHLFFSTFERLLLAESVVGRSSAESNGILRLRQSPQAPSRSGLKLDEALRLMLPADQREQLLQPAATAVDLGAAPGGWTWQLVRRHMRVTAVDNGPMQAGLLESGLVEHRRQDGFRYRPSRPVDLLVCDIVDKPSRVAALVARWLEQGWCRAAVFNLKLPMKQRYRAIQDCLRLLPQDRSWQSRCRHLYHDRDEVTVSVLPVGSPGRPATLR